MYIKRAYAEVDEFLSLLDIDTQNEIPIELREFFSKNKDESYKKEIDINIPIREQNLMKETLAIIAFLNLKYWCKDPNEKMKLKKIYEQNEKKYTTNNEKSATLEVEKIVENIEKKENLNKKSGKKTETQELVKVENSLIKRLLSMIRRMFGKKK